MALSRRDFLKYAGTAGAWLAGGSFTSLIAGCGVIPSALRRITDPPASTDYSALDPRSLDNFNAPLNLPGSEGLFGVLNFPSSSLDIVANKTTRELLKGRKADLMLYRVGHDGKTYLNPVIQIKKGSRFSTRLIDQLGEDTIIHWHGLYLPGRMNGNPSDAIKNGKTYAYDFTVLNRSGAYWYHAHPNKLVTKQIYGGLASFFIVEDDDELRLRDALDLKFGVTDLPLLLQDKRFNADGNIVYNPSNMEEYMGFLGDTVLVNLTPNPSLEVSTRIYRLRLLNGSNKRIYKLAFLRGKEKVPYMVIGTDGGLLENPYRATEMFLSPGERLDILIDLKDFKLGDIAALKSLPFDPMENECTCTGGTSSTRYGSTTSGMMGTSKLPEGKEFFILKMIVTKRVAYDKAIPKALSTITSVDASKAKVRPFTLSTSMKPMQWYINGKTFKMDEFPVTVKKNTVEIWEIANEKVSMPHPMHLHGFQFQVVERKNSPRQVRDLAVDGAGRLATDRGWKDTVLVWPGETVRIAIDFTSNFPGEQDYVFHCHNLEHEATGMMINYRVVS